MKVTHNNIKDFLYTPNKYFVVTLDVIDQAVSLIVSDEIVNYEYDDLAQSLILRSKNNG